MPPLSSQLRAAKEWALQDSHREQAKKLHAVVIQLFTDHPAQTGETYLQHLWFTVRMAFRIITCGLTLAAHGLLPFLFTRTASRQIEAIYVIFKNRIPKDRRDQLEIIYEI
jgi:hypothetical protein